MLTAHQLEAYCNKLHSMRANLDGRSDALRDEACHGSGGEDSGGLSNAPIHLGDLGSQEAGVAVNVGLAVNEASMRQEIDEALRRCDHGTFGFCELCRNEIGANRLNAVPYARLCIRCAERGEREGRS